MGNPSLSLPELIDLMCSKLQEIGYAESTVHSIKVKCLRLDRYARKNGHPNTFSLELIDQFLRDEYHYPYPNGAKLPEQTQDIASQMRKLIDFTLHGVVRYSAQPVFPDYPVIFRNELTAFLTHMESNDYSKGTKKRVLKTVCDFAKHLESKGLRDLSSVSGKHITDFVSTLYHYAPKTIGLELFGVRLFLRFLALDGVCGKDMSLLVPKINCKEPLRLPTVWNSEEIERIISFVDRGNPAGQRDYAVILLVARLGLRNSDLCNLKLDDINWDASTLEFIQVKTIQTVRLPLPEDVGLAIIHYLQNSRPKSKEPYVFLRHTPPFEKLQSFSHIMARAVAHAGFKLPPDKLHGIHSLRHSLASRLLEKDIPINVIGNILGHTSMDSTKTYLRIDLKSLQGCAIDPDEVL